MLRDDAAYVVWWVVLVFDVHCVAKLGPISLYVIAF
jgi:hypothetical protein